MLMNGLDALAYLALQERTATSTALQFRLAEFPDVAIQVKPAPQRRSFTYYIATQCIFYGFVEVVRQKRYKEVEVDCKLNETVLAVVNIGHDFTASTASSSPSPLDAANNSLLLPAAAPLQAATPEYHYLTPARPIPIPLAFITAVNALARFASHPSTSVVPRCYTDPGPEFDACMVFPADGPSRPRPPFLEYRWAVAAVKGTVGFMRAQRRWAECGGRVVVDGVDVGRWILERGKPWD
ncbi:MAG: hypothetical protein Q9219_003963 [cf. Caloplaca sp. 3 TL-2023]